MEATPGTMASCWWKRREEMWLAAGESADGQTQSSDSGRIAAEEMRNCDFQGQG